jgi:hypothetical protein
MHVPIKLMTEGEKKLAKNCSQPYFTSSSSAILLSLRVKTGLNWKAKKVVQSSDQKYQVANGKLRESLKLDEDDPVKYQSLLDALDKMKIDEVARTVAARAASSKDADESTDDGSSREVTLVNSRFLKCSCGRPA